MLKFLKKQEIWSLLDNNRHTALGWKTTDVHMKTWQDVVIYEHLREVSGKKIAEIGGGNSRILRRLAEQNRCINVDKLEGQHGGPKGEPTLPNVETVRVFLGDFSDQLEDNSFDFVISVSVVEHLPETMLGHFFEDALRIMKPGAVSLHAIDMYLSDKEILASKRRLDKYRTWLEDPRIRPLGAIEADRAVFSTDMVTNPDLTMWYWNQTAPGLKELRETTQGVSLLLGFTYNPQ